MIETFSETFTSIRQLLVGWDPFHIYASELESKYFTLSYFDGNLFTDVNDTKSLNPGDFLLQNGRTCKGFRPAAIQGRDPFCMQPNIMQFRNVPFEASGQESWMYAAFNQGGVGVSKETVMNHFAAETILKSAATGLNVFSRYLRYYTTNRQVSDYDYQPKGERPFQWQGLTYSGVHKLVDGGRSIVFPASDGLSSPLTLKFSEDPAN